MSILRKALLEAAFGIIISFSAYAGASGQITAFSSPSDLTLYPESIAAPGYQTAGLKFLPEMQDSEVSWGGREFPDDHNRGNNCSGYELSTCPAHASCLSCPFDRSLKKLISCASGYTQSSNSCTAGSCEAIGYKSEIPANHICNVVTEGRINCYSNCKAVSCSGYSLNCDAFNVANSTGKTACPDCSSSSANCSPKLCKVSGCADGYKIADNGTICVALDDTCPNGYFKQCDSTKINNPIYTEAGTACWQCSALPVDMSLPILYSDLTTSKKIETGKIPIGVVFDESKKLAIALNSAGKAWSKEYFDISGLNNITSSTTVLTDWNGKKNTKTIIDYCTANSKSCPAAEYTYSYTTEGTKAGDWYLPALAELNAIFTNKTAIDSVLSTLNGGSVKSTIFWTSSEYSDVYAWGPYLNSGLNDFYYAKQNVVSVRPVINYGDVNKGLPILYSDLTTSTEVISGKTPIGVVFDESRKLAIALTDSRKYWSTAHFDIPNLTNNTAQLTVDAKAMAEKDFNGKNNTNTIVSYCNANGKNCPAANFAAQFNTEGTSAGDWYLPAGGEVNHIAKNWEVLNEVLTKINGKKLAEYTTLWSSSESTLSSAWSIYLSKYGSSLSTSDKLAIEYNVRPVIDYGDVAPVCSVSNCVTCVSGSSSTCKTCESGYNLSNGKCLDECADICGQLYTGTCLAPCISKCRLGQNYHNITIGGKTCAIR